MNGVRVIGYRDWPEYSRDFFTELFGSGGFRHGVYLFRGEGSADHRLTSFFDRRFARLPLDRRMALWDRVVAQWRVACADDAQPEADGDEAALLALGQHHGLPTRMLDWSVSPYVAAWFAFNSHLTDAVPGDRVAVWVLHLNEPVWTTRGVEVVHVPSRTNQRLRRQGGRFTLCRAAVDSLEDYVERFATGVALTKCVLPAAEAPRALADLDAMGINNHEMFGDLTGLAGLAVLRAVLDDGPR